MDSKEAFRQAAQAISGAANTPGYEFTAGDWRLCGADGHGGRPALLTGFVAVADGLQKRLIQAGGAPPTPPAVEVRQGDEVRAISEWIGFSCVILAKLGGNPNDHINALLR